MNNDDLPTSVNELIPLERLYSWAVERFDLSERALQWYVTKGFLPKPYHIGREAFFVPIVKSYLWVIYILQKDFGLKLQEIERIIKGMESCGISKLHGSGPLMYKTAQVLLGFYKKFSLPVEAAKDFSESLGDDWEKYHLMKPKLLDILKKKPEHMLQMDLFKIEEEVVTEWQKSLKGSGRGETQDRRGVIQGPKA